MTTSACQHLSPLPTRTLAALAGQTREISRITGLSRNTVAKWLQGEVDGPPKYRRGGQPNKLTVFHEALQQALKADARRPKHERRTAKALYAEI